MRLLIGLLLLMILLRLWWIPTWTAGQAAGF
jgi:hypothetical protein